MQKTKHSIDHWSMSFKEADLKYIYIYCEINTDTETPQKTCTAQWIRWTPPETTIQAKKQLCHLSPPLGQPNPTRFLPFLKATTVLKGKDWLNRRKNFLTIRANELPHTAAVAVSHGNILKQKFCFCQRDVACEEESLLTVSAYPYSLLQNDQWSCKIG